MYSHAPHNLLLHTYTMVTTIETQTTIIGVMKSNSLQEDHQSDTH